MDQKQANKIPMHQGKWTTEEEEYTQCLIKAFKAGVVPISEGTTLRVFLCSMLNCPPKRISKKFVGTNYNGKQVYVRKDDVNPKVVSDHRKKLRELEQRFLNSLVPIIDFQKLSQKKDKKEQTSDKRETAPTKAADASLLPPSSPVRLQNIPVQEPRLVAPQQGNLPPQKLTPNMTATVSALTASMGATPPVLPANTTTSSLNEAVMTNSFQRLLEMRALREGLERRLSAQTTTLRQQQQQQSIQDHLLRRTATAGTNTRPLGTTHQDHELLLAMLVRQPTLTPFSLLAPAPAAAGAYILNGQHHPMLGGGTPPLAADSLSSSSLLNNYLKRKFEGAAVGAPGQLPATKKFRN